MENSKRQESKEVLCLTPRFTRAIDYARQVHINCRKGTRVPYMAHLLGVASFVMGENGYLPFPVTEDMVIAALLHDAVEDAGGCPRLRDIRANFGEEVAKIVQGCTDSFEEDSNKKQEWELRKADYIKRLREEPPSTLLVSAADKLYNARAILEDYKHVGPKIWERFKRGPDKQLPYFKELIKVFEERGSNRLVKELKVVVAELARLSASDLPRSSQKEES
jgi:(p)ppGpp synthase/HD superfamily hydrolase